MLSTYTRHLLVVTLLFALAVVGPVSLSEEEPATGLQGDECSGPENPRIQEFDSESEVCLVFPPGGCDQVAIVRTYIGDGHYDCDVGNKSCMSGGIIFLRIVGSGAQICKSYETACSGNIVLMVHVTGNNNDICTAGTHHGSAVVCSGNVLQQVIVIGWGNGNHVCGVRLTDSRPLRAYVD